MPESPMKSGDSMPTVSDGPASYYPWNGRPLWKAHWDEVLLIARDSLAKAKWPVSQDFIDIKVTTPKSHGVYRVFRVYQSGIVELGRVMPAGKIVIVKPQQIELTRTHIEEFRKHLSKLLGI